ncbi:outer membrane beta-barrel protein [Sediminibacterium roseum]|uniref:Outer membrane beta-barrel protein n=1 Tax=Sediminibacterium roseum TaxID=1978412 RepID=A0ABW9ZSX3_9BACT|nr:outer membrane beta-barrel protein [Sediminibacterium roseum]NCI50215.1 outer membrane beta-barrel protein [Sediminibacterium roseum]
MKQLLCFILFLLVQSQAKSQGATITGRAIDSSNVNAVNAAVVVLLRPTDSTLYRFGYAKKNGRFELSNIAKGPYIISVYYPGYATFSDTITVSGDEQKLELGTLLLFTKAHILQEVIVNQSKIRFKNDTTEFIADSFKVRAGATVEEMIRVLPGFSVDRKGVVTAHGETVRTVLVDGEEFFGNDPTMATRNLSASDVAKVQFYDQASKRSMLTGISDGSKQKAINLVLKNDAKRGYFGKVEGGTDFNKYYQGKVTGNKFTANSKMGFYSAADNTGNNEMSFSESQDYGSTIVTFDGGSIRIGGTVDEFSSSEGEGVPQNIGASGMYNKKYSGGSGQHSTANNYSYRQQDRSGLTNLYSKYLLRDTTFINTQQQSFVNSKYRHSFGTKNELTIDSFNVLNVDVNAEASKYADNMTIDGLFTTTEEKLISNYQRRLTSATTYSKGKAEIFWRKRSRRAGRLFSAGFGFERSMVGSDGVVFNRTDQYDITGLVNSKITDQKKSNEQHSSGLQAILSYTEPLSKKASLNFNYTANASSTNQSFSSLNKKGGVYDSLDQSTTSDFRFNNYSHRLAGLYSYTFSKGYFRIGFGANVVNIESLNKLKDSTLRRRFTGYFPNVNYRTKLDKTTTFTFVYQGYMQPPSFNFLQPVQNNIDPLNVFEGNPNLAATYTNAFTTSISTYNNSTNQSIFFRVNLSTYQDAIGYQNTIDAYGARFVKPINVNGNLTYSTVLSITRPIEKLHLQFDFSPTMRFDRVNNITNATRNTTFSRSYSLGLKIDRTFYRHFDGYIWYVPSVTTSESTINKEERFTYFTNMLEEKFNLDIRNDWLLSTRITTYIRPALGNTFSSANFTVWDISVEKKLSKSEDIRAMVSVNDLLNSRQGIDRNGGTNFVFEKTYQTVQRCFLFSLRWRFSKNRKIEKND